MGIFDSIREVVTQKPVRLKKPDFYKADSDARMQLERLNGLLATAPDGVKPQIERDIKLLSYGIAGEESVAFELNNSYLPLIVMHDLRLEHEGLSAQIDYLIITTKFCLVVECKNLFGNLEVNSRGEFIRELDFNGKRKKEGIYSPVTQNARHMEMIKRLRVENKKNPLMRVALEKSFGDFHRSVIVLANPKTVINLKRAPKVVKDQIIRSDQLIEHIKRLLRESKDMASSEKDMYEMAEFFVGLHKENPVDYAEKYILGDSGEKGDDTAEALPDQVEIDITETPLYQALKQYRYETSKAEGIKAFYVYNNSQLEALIEAMPANLDELKKVSGFGDVKCEKYGEAIIEIVDRYKED
ncbi:HRDC domain-containing protein [Trichococcus patagoniensis]|uniref:HRDC domain-containing protein n=1 Tax=Trichococcus patagoniensis TaxID=382641 RepID=A0A2T5IQ79_9LACT|nr:HRDC domain-containing protein [Trichococcus patagoniensis]PTQ85976.1 HRDC domain-containing protein [Trichococcus patagoniensis]